MKILLLLAGVLLSAAFAVPAAAEVRSKKSGQDPEAVRAYWTAERMQKAIPVTRTKTAGPKQEAAKPGGSTSSWSTVKVNWLTAPPILKAHGKVFFSDGPYNYVCSGTAVSGGTGDVVWTAGHCVNEGPGDFYTNWAFVPAYNSNGSLRPYGTWAGTDLFTTEQWQTTANAYGYDLGAVRVVPPDTQSTIPAERTLKFAPDTTIGTSNQIDSYGYPAEGKYSGSDMYLCDTYVSRMDTSVKPATYGIPCGMNGGSSGGGWVDPDDGLVVSVNSYGYASLKNTMFGPQQGAAAEALYNAAIG